jgi:LysM repeat protein
MGQTNPDIIRVLMKNRQIIVLILLIIPVLLFGMFLPVGASPPAQQQVTTPTPGPDGRIVYIVQPGDSCFRVSAISGITVEQLRALNPQLDENCTLIVGAELVLGLAGPPPASPVPGDLLPTAVVPTITPTPLVGATEICVLLYEDANGNALREEIEFGIEGGAVSVSNTAGTYSRQDTTISEIDPDTEEPVQTCFLDVPEGEYNVSVAVPDNYNPTMEMTLSFFVEAGDRAFIDFGAQSKTVTLAEGEEPPTRSPVLGIFGILLLLGGLGLGWYAYQQRKPVSKLTGRKMLDR